jgi:hypothetical protein
MVKIYFCGCGYSDHILSERDPDYSSDSQHHYFTDILGRKYRIPIGGTILMFEPWDGNRSNLQRYHKVLDEMEGKSTGIAKK